MVTIYDLYFLGHAESTAAEVRRDYPSLAAAHARRADAVITISEHTAAQIQSRFGIEREAIAICPPGAPPWRPAEQYSSKGPILFMGTIEPRKNVGTLLRAYSELLTRMRDAPPLTLAGKVAPACKDVVDQLSLPPLAGRASHVGYVSGPEREQLYRDASMLVLPSLEEGFGMTAVEAMTVGVPVVASNRGALPEVVGDAGVLVDPADRAWANRAIESGRARAKRFTWDASAARLVQAYATAAERRRART